MVCNRHYYDVSDLKSLQKRSLQRVDALPPLACFSPTPTESPDQMGEWLMLCGEIIEILLSPKYKHLACVADLKSVRTKLRNGEYSNLEQFADEVREILSHPHPGADKCTRSGYQTVLNEFENLWAVVFLKGGRAPAEILEEDVGDEVDRELSVHFEKGGKTRRQAISLLQLTRGNGAK
uniref:DUF4378 domain-containing protein n=1 Tax=Angiostrongylus cantonensis TaxID=6313 RepID=A0A0K0DLK0_ANGCA